MEYIIFNDHRFCAGAELDVALMPEHHTHSQIEINYLLWVWCSGMSATSSSAPAQKR